MRNRISKQPPPNQTEPTTAPAAPEPAPVKPGFYPFGLSAEQFALVTRAMRATARKVCRHSGASPEDAVQQAFIKALAKPNMEQTSTHDQKKFVAWMCKLAKYEAMTNRQSMRRRAVREVATDTDICEIIAVVPSVGTMDARIMLEQPFSSLAPADQELLRALYVEGKSIDDLAKEQQMPWTTVKSHWERIVTQLSKALGAATALLVLVVPKQARAFVGHVTQLAPRVLTMTMKFSGVMTFSAVCGAALPTSSSVPTETRTNDGLPEYGASQTTSTQTASLEPSLVPQVEPEEPKELDAETNECSALDMKSTKFAEILPETLVALALTATPALTQVACTGSAQQTRPAQQADDEEYDAKAQAKDDAENYWLMCQQEKARRNTCPTQEEWFKEFRDK